MLIDHGKKFVLVAVPKTGSTSMHYSFADLLSVEFESKSGAPAIYHMYASDIKAIVGNAWDDFYSFAMIRNPYDRMVSLYHDFKYSRGFIKAKSFDSFVVDKLRKNWVQDIHFKPQWEFVSDQLGREIVVSNLFRYEEGVGRVFDKVCADLSLKSSGVGHARKSKRDEFMKYYSSREVVEVVNEVYHKDFEFLGYDKI